MSKEIYSISKYLLECDFMDDRFDPEGNEEHLNAADDLLSLYPWQDIYPVWEDFLFNHCTTPEKVINFVNLYIYYGASDYPIPNPLQFVGYIYYMVDMDKYWDEAGELFDGLAIRLLSYGKLVDILEDPYYSPLKDKRIEAKIAEWKKKKA